ncbi:ribonuclease H-like domain-containing protein [Tanacetum coccineum]|uniref:Ribonuclease H-like domain-containing protein n=1 Tax=Tanacetum coccineum TaxID=301880 RepID=A0ABQ5ES89_9ASTR
MSLNVTTMSPIPKSHIHVLRDTNWKNVMLEEYNALITNGTWVLVRQPTNVNIVRSMWLFRHKFNADRSLSRYKARLVANGRSQQHGIDCDETFSPVVKPATIRTVLSLAVSRAWPIHYDRYMGLSKPRALGFNALPLMLPESVFSTAKPTLHCLFFVAGFLNYYLGISVTLTSAGMFLSKFKYAEEILERDPPVTVFVSICMIPVAQSLDDPLLEAEYRDVANVVAETAWMRNLLRELHVSLHNVMLVYPDNVSVVYLSTNLVQHQRTKHIEIDLHFFHDYVAYGQVCVLHVPFRFQYGDIFTKGLPSALFFKFRSSLNVRRPLVPTAGEYYPNDY